MGERSLTLTDTHFINLEGLQSLSFCNTNVILIYSGNLVMIFNMLVSSMNVLHGSYMECVVSFFFLSIVD